MTNSTPPTYRQAAALIAMFDYYNAELFNNELDRTAIILCWTHRKSITGGFFCADKWTDEDGRKISELAINANLMRSTTLTTLHKIMAHEMVHALQHQRGTSGREGYHNADFCNICREIGLPPVNAKTNEEVQPGGGAPSCGNNVAEDGAFLAAFRALPDDAVFPFESDPIEGDGSDQDGDDDGGEGEGEGSDGPAEEKKPRRGVRSRYTCPVCGLRVWAKAGVRLMCANHDGAESEMVEQA